MKKYTVVTLVLGCLLVTNQLQSMDTKSENEDKAPNFSKIFEDLMEEISAQAENSDEGLALSAQDAKTILTFCTIS